MVKIDSNVGKQDSQCCICGQEETTSHLFEFEGDLTVGMYREITKDGGPKEETTILEEYAAKIQRTIHQRIEVKKILQ